MAVSAAQDGPKAGPVSAGALETLSLRFRPGGLCVIALAPDGNVLFHDSAAGEFFQHYVLPILQRRDDLATQLRKHLAGIEPDSNLTLWNFIPGVTMAAFPLAERKKLSAVILLAGKSASFKLNDATVHVCAK